MNDECEETNLKTIIIDKFIDPEYGLKLIKHCQGLESLRMQVIQLEMMLHVPSSDVEIHLKNLKELVLGNKEVGDLWDETTVNVLKSVVKLPKLERLGLQWKYRSAWLNGFNSDFYAKIKSLAIFMKSFYNADFDDLNKLINQIITFKRNNKSSNKIVISLCMNGNDNPDLFCDRGCNRLNQLCVLKNNNKDILDIILIIRSDDYKMLADKIQFSQNNTIDKYKGLLIYYDHELNDEQKFTTLKDMDWGSFCYDFISKGF